MAGNAKSGRAKGSKNHRTIELETLLEKHNFNPALALLDIHRRAIKDYEENKGLHYSENGTTDNRHKYLEIAERSANNLMKYVYPQRKAVDVSAEKEALQTFAEIANAARDRKKNQSSKK